MLVSLKAVLKQKKRHYSLVLTDKVADRQRIHTGEEAVAVYALDQRSLCNARHAFWN
jgi:hypothetical protein